MKTSFGSPIKEKPQPGILGSNLLRLLIQRLFLPTLVLLVLALGLAGFSSHRALDAQQMELARVLASTVETFLLNAEDMLRSSARVADRTDPDQLAFYLKSSREGFGYFDAIYRMDKNGIIVLLEPYEPRYMGLDQSRQPFFEHAKTQNGLYISKPFNSMRTGKPTVNMTWPLADGGMMVAELNLGTFQDAVAAAHHEQSKSTIIIVDQAGTFLAHPRSELITQQARISKLPFLQHEGIKDATLHYRFNNQWMVGSYTHVKTTNWLVLVQIPIAALFSPLSKMAVPLLLLCILIWILVVLTFRKRFWKYVIHPLTDLSQTALAISSGDLKRTVTVERDDEIGIVAKAFNSMTTQLREVIGHLERRVQQLTRTRETLKTHQEELENLVHERTAALTERTQQIEAKASELSMAKQQAEKANAAKSDFLARMSHEIRTPLNAVTGLTHIVLKSQLSTEQRDYLGKIQIASKNLLAVINDILDFSKIEAGQMKLEHHSFMIDEVMEQLADLFTDRIAQSDLELIFAVSPDVPHGLTGDAGRVTQVLTNLVANAIKFTRQGEVIVGVEPEEHASSQNGRIVLQFRVSDTGAGIAADVLPTLFDPFTQADSSLTRKHQGTGLGLAICQRLVELMGGRIWAESTPGYGSTFYFTVSVEGQKEKISRFRIPADLHELKALVADDSATARQVMGRLLESFTFNVTTVESGAKAILKLQNAPADRPYQLVLLDWKMPGLDGIETARRIRMIGSKALAQNQPAPIIIMVTAYGQLLIQEHIDTNIVDSVLLKPVKPSQLFNTIMALFRQTAPIVPQLKDEKSRRLRLAGRRVLVVEDSILNRDVAVALLTAAEINVSAAENGQEAVEKVAQSPKHYYDAVLMDIQMPVMDGYQATRHIRAWEKNTTLVERRIPIIALTAHALKGEKEKCMAAGMDDYIAKPIDERQLYQVLLKWFSHPKKAAQTAVQIPAEEKSDTQAVLDHQQALKRLGGRKQIYIKALKKFGPEFNQTHGAIARHLAAGDKTSASRLAHSVKGTAITIGAVRLSQVAAHIESRINSDDLVDDALLNALSGELEQTMTAINGFLNEECQ